MAHRCRAAGAAIALLSLGLFATACSSGGSGPGVARLGTPSANPSASAGGSASPVAYSQCMRSHGVPDFPDPDSQGRLSIKAGPGSDLDPTSPKFTAAQKACESLMPKPNASQQAQAYAAQLKFSQCMRAHGVPDFPDPQPDGGMRVQMKKGTDMDPVSPQFKSAQKACQNLAPGLGGTTTGGGGS
jgi:hypothetical protein